MTNTNDNSNKKTKKHVIFGTGPLGLSIMDALVVNGSTDITLVNRSGKVGESLPAGVTVVQGDVTKPDDVARIWRATPRSSSSAPSRPTTAGLRNSRP